ncbi:S8 family peptidase [Lactococcus petauri]|uniref:S8 family peptidase n=1 Tax=Lactococcus petauri TaxID=1940789 RepID=UPI0031FF3EDF
MTDKRRPILGRGESLVEPITKSGGGGNKKYPRSYEDALRLVSSSLEELEVAIDNIPDQKRMKDVVVAVKLNEGFLAKSYTPNTFFRSFDYQNIGSRNWKTDSGSDSKLNFVKINPQKIRENINQLGSFDSDAFKNDLRKIEDITLLDVDETVLGFDRNWVKGRVELVLHPFEETQMVLEKLYQLLDLSQEEIQKVKYKKYENGPLFVSTIISKENLQDIGTFNPLRTAHPLKVEINSYNREPFLTKVHPPENSPQVVKKIGVIDGGVDLNNPFFYNVVSQTFEVASEPSNMFLSHGSNVTSIALFGDLFDKKEGEKLEAPLLGVESIRVFPTSDTSDIDLYESIDLIEEAVPQLGDIDVFNISVGPVGNILDDDISRFTTALDQLAYDYRKLFVVAVGNTGDKSYPLNRIQSPSDIVNGIGVGSYAIEEDGSIFRADYSSIGFGREGCKIKPDLCEHGGSSSRPLQVINAEGYSMSNVTGTSFSAPLVAKKAAELMIKSRDVNTLTARALLTQTASNDVSDIDRELGYGACVESTDDILTCLDNKVIVIYNNEMSVKETAKLRIPIPVNGTAKKYKISWTIVSDTKPNPLFSEGYTSTALEDTFYKNENVFRYKFGKKTKTKNILKHADEISELISQGYKKGTIPVSASADRFKTEADMRNKQKWDTVVKRSKICTLESLDHPFLTLHALDRETDRNRVRYSVAITIEALNSNENLYDEILNEYSVLQPIGLKLENELQISNTI